MTRSVSLFDTNADTPCRPTCGDCRFFSSRGQSCRRYPPTLWYDVGNLQRVQAFPNVSESMWCGEFSPRLAEITPDSGDPPWMT